MPLTVGSLAPDFELMDQTKRPVKLSSLRGKKVVLLFYPLDFSPVCTDEMCKWGPQIGQIKKDDNTIVFGINGDHPFSHEAFRRAYNIPFDLLADPTKETLKAYDMFAGGPYACSKRGTVVISPDGKIAHYEGVEMKHVRTVEELAAAVK